MRRIISWTTLMLLGVVLGAARPALSQSYFKEGKIHLVLSSHHDLGFHKGSYEAEMRFVFAEIDRALDLMKEDPEFTFAGEYTVWLMEYLARRPARVAELKQRFKEGRMEWGAGYTMPYPSLITSEQWARQMYLGPRWFKRTFPARASIYFNTDVPAFGIQMPQILRKSGVDKVFLSRSWNLGSVDTDHVNWIAPDGSEVFCYFMHHYGNDVGSHGKKRIGNNLAMASWVRSLETTHIARKIPPHLVQFLCMDCRMPKSRRESIDTWNAYARYRGLPLMQYSTLGQAMDAVKTDQAKLKNLMGEWPNKWVYEAAPSNYELITDQRESGRLLLAAEAFSTFRALVEKDFGTYPTKALDEAWKQSVFSCHGFAPRAVLKHYAEAYKGARNTGRTLLSSALGAIACRVNTGSKGLPLVVFNTLGWNRTDMVEMKIPAGSPEVFAIVDSQGKTVPTKKADRAA